MDSQHRPKAQKFLQRWGHSKPKSAYPLATANRTCNQVGPPRKTERQGGHWRTEDQQRQCQHKAVIRSTAAVVVPHRTIASTAKRSHSGSTEERQRATQGHGLQEKQRITTSRNRTRDLRTTNHASRQPHYTRTLKMHLISQTTKRRNNWYKMTHYRYGHPTRKR